MDGGENSNFETRRDALVAQITAAFDGVSREDGTTLHEAEALDDRKSAREQRAARALDLEERWQDVPDKEIAWCCHALSFLDAKGFRYYLPAFMRYGLRHRGDPDDNGFILSSCMHQLTQDFPTSVRKSDPAKMARVWNFTNAQSRAVAAFLRFVIEFEDGYARQATVEMVEKWEEFCEAGNDEAGATKARRA
ncbi:MAG: hypothetical protein QOG00_1323 [Pyrinomonadaceae bacterium]|nr:hypothetical protein [Pyrinomonadaceae bacterium]